MTSSSTVATAAPPAEPAWFDRRGKLILLAVLVCVGAWIRVANLQGVTDRSPDEAYYTWQVNTLLDHGTTDGYRILFDHFDMNLPSPTRAGYHWLLMATMRLTGDRTPLAGARLSCFVSILTLALVAWIGWRFFSATVALVATLLYGVYPAELVLARRCWVEALVELLTLASFALVFYVMSGERRRVIYVPYVLVGVACITVKETAAGAFLFATMGILLVLAVRRERRAALEFAGAGMGSALLAAIFFAMRFGGLAQLSQFYKVTQTVSLPSDYSRDFESGSAAQLLQGMWSFSAVVTLLALVGVVAAVVLLLRGAKDAEQRARAQAALGMAVFCAAFLALAVLVQKENFRHICGIFAPLMLLAGMGFQQLLTGVGLLLPVTEAGSVRVLLVAGLLGGAVYDLHRFHSEYAGPAMKDLSIRMVLQTSGSVMNAVVVPPTVGLQPTTAAGWIQMSASLVQAGKNEEAIVAAKNALALDPKSALAWNNIAAADENMQRWDEAIQAAQNALAIQPDFQLAKNNLAWSVEQKRKQGR